MRRQLLCLSIFFSLALPSAAQESPERTFVNIQKAIDSRDLALFKKYVAVTSILNEGVGIFLKKASLEEGSSSNLSLSFLLGNPERFEKTRATLVKEIAEFVDYGVSSGFFSGETTSSQPTGFFSLLIARSSKGRKEIIAPEKQLLWTREGEEIRTPVVVKDHGNGRYYTALVTMRPYRSIWRIEAVNNMDELLKEAEGG